MIVVLSGGSGGAKFVWGLGQLLAPDEFLVVINTGDDLTLWGLHVSPDIDSILYALAGVLSRDRGWGVEGDTFRCLDSAARLGLLSWFRLGDSDLAMHLARTELLRNGKTLAEATRELKTRLGVGTELVPMTNARVETRIETSSAELSFQEYFVRERWRPEVRSVRFAGIEQAEPAPGILQAIAGARAILIAPSNPITSIGPILAVPGIRQALRTSDAPVIAISPIIGNRAVSGPAGELMRASGLAVSLAGVARCYEDFLDLLIGDEQDRASAKEMDVSVTFSPTLMTDEAAKVRLAAAALHMAGAEVGHLSP